MPRFYETTLSITNLHNLSISTHVNRSRILFEFPALPILSLLHSHWLNIFDGIYYIRDIECMQLNNKTEDPENLKTE